MTAPEWMNEAVRAFGRQLNLQTFALNAAGAAGLTFENGVTLRLEYANEALLMVAGLKADPEAEAIKRLLTDVNPDAPRGRFPVRAAFMARTGELVYVVRLDEREVNESTLGAAFGELWDRIERLRRAL